LEKTKCFFVQLKEERWSRQLKTNTKTKTKTKIELTESQVVCGLCSTESDKTYQVSL